MFTFRPPSKNGNGHKNGNGKGHSNGNGNGSTQSLTSALFGNGHKAPAPRNGNGNGHSHKIESVLGPGIHFKGALTGTGGVRIEGTFDGSINVQGAVVIEDGAKVTADIYASAVSIGGSLQGNLVAGKVSILSTGRVWGDLTTGAFATEEGAYLRGQVCMEDVLPEPPAPSVEAEASSAAAPM